MNYFLSVTGDHSSPPRGAADTITPASRHPSIGGRHAALWLIVAIVSLWLRAGFPVVAIGWAIYDDAFFVRTAHYLSAGKWLGPYDGLTLTKGMFYPLFMCLASLADIPLNIAEQGAYLAASGLVAWLVARQSGRRWLGSLLFVALAFNPSLWNPELARVIREGLYVSQSLAVVAMAVIAAFPGKGRDIGKAALLGGALGLLGAGFWLTREEGVWLVPAVAIVVLIAIAASVWPQPAAPRLLAIGASLVAAALVFSAGIGVVARLNAHYYGVAETNELKSPNFERAYGALARIKPDVWRRDVVSSADSRRRAYGVSPAARELAPWLDGPQGDSWHRIGCDEMRIPVASCPDILSGWFIWALRDAVASAGHRSAPDAQAFYGRLADQIDAACKQGKLACLPPRATLAPPFRWQYLQDSVRPAGRVLWLLLTMRQGDIGSEPSVGTPAQIATFADAVGTVSPVKAVWGGISGWAAAKSGVPKIWVRAKGGESAGTTTLSPADYVRATFPDMQPIHFDISANCMDACKLVVQAPGEPEVVKPWKDVKPGMVIDNGQVRAWVDFASVNDNAAMTGRRRALQVGIARVIGRIYAAIFPALTIVGLCGLGVAVVRARRGLGPTALLALAVGSALAISARVALLAYLDATSMPIVSLHYASPAIPFVIVVAVVGTYLGAQSLREMDRTRRSKVAERS